ncbi:hypothetical protein SLS55_009798 [Diplodia seriata]|uniref:Uncharacterized protein n=1 Tax=Diplodia seriata TaxID=420778 RepID=A0ABR3C117_9PEZI
MKEILVHLSAPTSRKDDERYRRLAEAYDDFEPATTIDCTARNHVNSTVNQGDHQASAAPHDILRTPADFKAVRDRNQLSGEADAGASANRVPRAAETPAAAGFVEPAEIVPASRQSVAKGKKPENFAHAPDFGSFMSTPASRSPIEQIHEIERRWVHQQRSSAKRSASGRSKTSTGASTPHPLYIEDTQEALAMLEDYVDASFYGSDAHFSDIESPIAQRTSKRPRLSCEAESLEPTQANYDAGSQESTTPPIPSTWMPPPRTPPRESMSSQMVDDYGLSNSESSLRASDDSGPVVESKGGSHETSDPAPEKGTMSNPWRPSGGESSSAHPETPKNSRKAAKSDEDVKVDIVEARFRTGWPKLVPQPTISRLSSNPEYYVTEYPQKEAAISAILQVQGVSFNSFCLVERKSAGSQSFYPTLLVEATSRSGSWYNAVLRLSRLLQDTTGKYDGNIHVEIVEFGSDTPRIFPIHADDDILNTWRNLGESVVSCLARYQVHWKLLSLVKLSCRPYGANAGPPTTTMLIEAWDPDADDWELKILPGLKGLIKNTAIENVEIWQAQGHSSDGGGKLNVANLPERTWWETPLRIGDGLGPQDISSTGTLGGFVRIEDPVKKVESICILTNCHVVMPCPGLTEQMTPNPPETALKALNITENPLSHIVMSPSYPDLKEKIELLELDIQATKEEAYGPLPPGALPPLAERAQWGDKKAIRALQVSKEITDRLEAQSKTTDVLKVGRATGWTQGEISHAEAWMNLTQSSNGITWKKEYGTVVQCMRVENPRGPQDSFSIGGDSGSMVVDTRDGACVGLVFGGNEAGTYALMTPIEDVFSSIEKVTGCRIVMPRLVA